MKEISTRQAVAVCAWLNVALALAATVAFLVAYGFDPQRLAHPGAIFDHGGTGASLRWAGLIDMASYLAMAPVVIYIHSRHLSSGPDARESALVQRAHVIERELIARLRVVAGGGRNGGAVASNSTAVIG